MKNILVFPLNHLIGSLLWLMGEEFLKKKRIPHTISPSMVASWPGVFQWLLESILSPVSPQYNGICFPFLLSEQQKVNQS